jgi:hypothetical protein
VLAARVLAGAIPGIGIGSGIGCFFSGNEKSLRVDETWQDAQRDFEKAKCAAL